MSESTRITYWNATPILDQTETTVFIRVDRAMTFVRDQAKRSINRGNADGKHPSREGQPPKKVSALLFLSVAKAVWIDGRTIYGAVGTNLIYGRRLELGFVGVDSLGRKISQGPRPWLRPALINNAGAVRRILGIKAA